MASLIDDVNEGAESDDELEKEKTKQAIVAEAVVTVAEWNKKKAQGEAHKKKAQEKKQARRRL